MVITQKIQFYNSSLKFLPVQKGGFQETACPKDRLDGSWLSPWLAGPQEVMALAATQDAWEILRPWITDQSRHIGIRSQVYESVWITAWHHEQNLDFSNSGKLC